MLKPSFPDIIPLNPSGDLAHDKEAIQSLLSRRGPTPKEALECWAHKRDSICVELAVLSMFERGEVDLSWSDKDKTDVLVSRGPVRG